MKAPHRELTRFITRELSRNPGPAFLLGSVPLALSLSLSTHHPLLVTDDQLKPGKLAKLVRRSRAGAESPPPGAGLAVVRADPLALPASEESLSIIVAAGVLCRVPHAREAIESWSTSLAPGGSLVLIEDLSWGANLSLKRLNRRGMPRLTSEDLTCLMLNSGYTGIGQAWPSGRSTVVTTGTRAPLA